MYLFSLQNVLSPGLGEGFLDPCVLPRDWEEPPFWHTFCICEVDRCWQLSASNLQLFTAKAVAFRLLLWVNFSQAPKFTEISDRLEYLLKKYFIWGLPKTAISQKKFFWLFSLADYATRPFTAFTWLQNLNKQVGTEDDSKMAPDCSGLAPKMDDVGPPDSFFD